MSSLTSRRVTVAEAFQHRDEWLPVARPLARHAAIAAAPSAVPARGEAKQSEDPVALMLLRGDPKIRVDSSFGGAVF